MNRAEAIELHARHLSRHKLPLYEEFGWDVVEGRREGVHIWDLDGRRYFDCHVCGGVYNLGHRNPEVIAAARAALDRLDIGNHHLVSTERSRLAAKLVKSAGEGPGGERMARVVWASGGGEAMDFAFKLARGYTRRRKILCLDGGYHGHTGLAMGAGDDKYVEPWMSRPPHFQKVGLDDLACIERHFDDDTAAVSLETVPATLGMALIPREVMRHVRRVTAERGILLILDEIQTGCGRTGETWAFQHYGVLPDIFATGKGFSGGIYPMAATVYRDELERVFEPDPLIHFSSFGGSEIGCAVAEVVLEKATDQDFLAHVRRTADYFRSEIERIAGETPKVVGMRQLGLFQAIEFRDVPTCVAAVKQLNANGVFCVFANNDRVCVQFMPPLTITEAEAAELVGLVRKSIAETDAFDLTRSSYFRTQTEARLKNVVRHL